MALYSLRKYLFNGSEKGLWQIPLGTLTQHLLTILGDAFSNLRASVATIEMDFQMQDAIPPELEVIETNGGAVTHLTNKASAGLTVSGPNQEAGLQSYSYAKYRSGQSLDIDFTATFYDVLEAGLYKEGGLYDDADGIFVRVQKHATLAKSDIAMVVRYSTDGTVKERVYKREDWDDPLDGTGPSKIRLDLNTKNIWALNLQWLGAGAIQCCMNIDRVPIHFLTIANANALEDVYMRTASLPPRWMVWTDGTYAGGSETMQATCFSVHRRGNFEEPFRHINVTRDTDAALVGTEWRGILGVRLKDDFIKRGFVPSSVHVLNRDTTDPIEWRLCVNPTIVSGSPTWNPTTGEVTEYAAAPAGSPVVVDVGPRTIIIAHGYVGAGGPNTTTPGGELTPEGLRWYRANRANTEKEFICLAARTLNTASNCRASIGFRER